MKTYKLIHIFFMGLIALAISACVPKATEKKAICGTDQAFSNTTRSCYSIVAPNKAPVAANITPAAFNEDVQSIITLSYSDIDFDKATKCQVIGTPSHVTVTEACTCSEAGVCTVGVTGVSDYFGAAQFSYNVQANGMISNTAIATLSLTAINDAPTISSISAQTTLEDTANAISFTITDADSILSCSSSVSVVTNTNTALAPTVAITGVAPNCIATITPATNQSGTSDITLQVSDGALSANSSFLFTVTAVNDGPSFSFLTSTSTNEDTITTVNFTLGDTDSTIDCTAAFLSTSTSNTLLVPSINIAFSGVYPNCVATITPLADQNGTTHLTFIATDGSASTSSNAFTLTVNAVNDAPVISAIADTSTTEDVAKAIAFTITDLDNTLTCAGSVSATSSNTTVIPVSGIVITGTAPNCTATITPAANQSSVTPVDIILTVTDGSLTDTSPFALTVNYVDDIPYFNSTIVKADTNEGGMVVAGPFKIDEDEANTSDEDSQFIQISSIVSDNTSILPSGSTPRSTSAIRIFYDLNDNGVEDNGEARDLNANLENTTALDGGIDNSQTTITVDSTENFLESGTITIDSEIMTYTGKTATTFTGVTRGASSTTAVLHVDNSIVFTNTDGDAHSFYLKLYPIAGISGNANITLTATDGTTPITSTFSLIVHSVAALHGGWANISAIGMKTDKNGAPAADTDVQCNYNKSTDTASCGSSNCTQAYSPTSVIIPDAANVLFWDSANKKCYRSTGTTIYSWVDFKTSCPLVRNTSCTGGNCISSTAPIPSAVGQFYYNTGSGCYISTGTTSNTEWISYIPSKVTLTWNTFTLSGSGSDSSATIYGWNVYRREAGHDYNFDSGFLKNTSTDTMTISSSSVKTFTDTTAVAGKIYYYLVRPVDSTTRHLTVSTPEIYSEVRVLAPAQNYSFVHRWMVNQEICNSMHMTTTTTNKVDPTHNYRCPYKGPGETSGYYDIGKDMLVDISESGCPYTKAPSCTSNGCVGIGDPATLTTAGTISAATVAADNIYYDRSAGSCYRYNGAAWINFNTSINAAVVAQTNTALNAPLVNISQTLASSVCSNRVTATAVAHLGIANGAVSDPPASLSLPSKKEYIAYSAAPYNTSDATITDMEEGFSLNLQSRCNSSNGNGIDTAFSDSTIPSTSYIFSLPGTFSSGIRSLYTGSVPWGINYSTETCSSRYGMQDVYGNVAEWVTDKMTCNSSTNVCVSNAGTDLGDYDFDTNYSSGVHYGFDMVTGPYNDVDADSATGSGDALLTDWIFRDELFGAGKFNFPLGVPMYTDIGTGTSAISGSTAIPYLLDIGPTAGITTSQLHEDGITINGALTTLISSVQASAIETTALTLKATATTHYANTSATLARAIAVGYDIAATGTDGNNAYLAAVTANSSALAAYNAAVSAASAATVSKNAIVADPSLTATSDLVAETKSLITAADTLVATASTDATTAQTKAYTGGLDATLETDSDTAKASGLTMVTDSGLALAAANVVVSGIGGWAVGGSYLSGNLSGRYSSELIPAAVVRDDIGFRCYIPIDKDNYPLDASRHPYSYSY